MSRSKVLVAGGGGFIGGHLAKDLLERGHEVVCVDWKPLDEWHQIHPQAINRIGDLREKQVCFDACQGVETVYMLAADMGGMGFIETHKAECMLSVLISTHMLMAAQACGVQCYFYSSTACVYNAEKQTDANVTPLKESDAYPALPEDGYGWEKLFSERMCRHFLEDYGLETRVARFHNVYGAHGTWEGGREKAPAAICRKVVEAKLSGRHEIEIWGDGKQTRSFMYIDDCIEGIHRIANHPELVTLNLGSNELVTINGLVDLVESIAGIRLERHYKLDAPRGVNGRNSDNTLIEQTLGWSPSIRLRDGLEKTYAWIYDEYVNKHAAGVSAKVMATTPPRPMKSSVGR